MEISFRTTKLRKVLNSERLLKKEYGEQNARLIMKRLVVLSAAPSLKDVSHQRPERRHELTGSRAGEFAVDIAQPFRLVFRPALDPVPKLEDGGIDLVRVTSVEILSVEDYH